MMSAASPTLKPARLRSRAFGLESRYKLILGGIIALIAAILVIIQAVNAYSISYNLFSDIAVVNSANVDAAELALEYLASTSQATADYTALTPDNPIFEQALISIFRDFHSYRDQMFILKGNAQTDAERTAFNVADTYTYSRYWRHISNLMAQRSNIELARKQYLFADDHLRNQIIPSLERLEALNFDGMALTGERAGGIMTVQAVILAVLVIGLAVGLTALSFWLRRKVRRYITPGLDIAMILAWAVALVMLGSLLSLPEQLRVMIDDSYRSVSASSRVLVDANLANRAESTAVIFPERSTDWYAVFDSSMALVELRMCGQPGCMESTFLASGTTDTVDPAVRRAAQSISAEDSARIGNIVPLVGNVTFRSEAATLEQARLAYLTYRQINQQFRDLIDTGDVQGALDLNTGEVGTQAFQKFAQAITDERLINRSVFDQVWKQQQASIPTNQGLYGVVAYIIIMLLIAVGVYHRYREL
jgi:hypothetical protein